MVRTMEPMISCLRESVGALMLRCITTAHRIFFPPWLDVLPHISPGLHECLPNLQEEVEKYSDDLKELQHVRENATQLERPSHAGREALVRYAAQLEALEAVFPVSETEVGGHTVIVTSRQEL